MRRTPAMIHRLRKIQIRLKSVLKLKVINYFNSFNESYLEDSFGQVDAQYLVENLVADGKCTVRANLKSLMPRNIFIMLGCVLKLQSEIY